MVIVHPSVRITEALDKSEAILKSWSWMSVETLFMFRSKWNPTMHIIFGTGRCFGYMEDRTSP